MLACHERITSAQDACISGGSELPTVELHGPCRALPTPGAPHALQAVTKKLATHKLTMMAFFTACVTLTMNSATTFLSTWGTSQTDAAAAGFVLLSMTNFIIIIIMGSFMEVDTSGDGTAEVTFKKQTASGPPPPTMANDVC